MKLLPLIFSFLFLSSNLICAQSIVPLEIVRPETPSLETAFGGSISIIRTPHKASATVEYEIRIYDSEFVTADYSTGLVDIYLAISDDEGNLVVRTPIDFSRCFSNVEIHGEGKHTSNVKDDRKFRQLKFTVRQTLESNAVVSIGRSHVLRTIYQGYRLPERTIIFEQTPPSAEQAESLKP